MGTWGTGIFSDDAACDVRDDFRELVAAKLSPQEATKRVIAANELAEPVDVEDGPAWMALAVTQWKLGRVVDEVRDTALRAIDRELAEPLFEGADRRKREAVLRKTREQLTSPPPAPKAVRRDRVPESPFVAGDVLRYTTASGRQVALWAMFTDHRQGLTRASVNTCFRVQAIGDPALPPLEEIVSQQPLVTATELGTRKIHQLFLHLPQDVSGPAWEVIGNAPFPDPGLARSGPFTVLTVKRTRSRPTLDDVFEGWWQEARVAEPVTRALEPFIDLFPTLATDELARKGRSPARTADVALELAVELHEGGDALGARAFEVVERYLAGGDRAQRRVAIDLLDSLVNAATHPEARFDRAELMRLLGPEAQAMVLRLDEAWETIEPTRTRPPELVPEGERRVPAVLFFQGSPWKFRLINRDLGDGTYRVCRSWELDIRRPSPASSVDEAGDVRP